MNFIFDLDGTLVDSLPGIAAALVAAFESIGRTLPEANLRAEIGPPISVIARRLAPSLTDLETLAIEQAYRPLYDDHHWSLTTLFPGVGATLHTLNRRGHSLFLLTNKPRVPAVRILEHLGLSHLFTDLYTRDCATPSFASKTLMLEALVAHHSLDPAASILVGDTAEDGEAAHANSIPFVFVTYGYGLCPSAANAISEFSALLHLEGLPA